MQQCRQQQEPTEASPAFAPNRSRNPRRLRRGGCQAYSSSVYAVTSHLEQRIWQHKNAIIDGFTHKYKVDQLVYFESHQSMYEAITREKQLKKWRREWNIELINSQNPTWQDLWYTVISGSPRPRG
ncbi:GIY-YIG nuclease family protein [Shewanella baltica]|uniref:GIY-YIG nuclease family protein n=1 Tax=Shewanella baltica TaxID=62322 RepID=UPI003D7AB748